MAKLFITTIFTLLFSAVGLAAESSQPGSQFAGPAKIVSTYCSGTYADWGQGRDGWGYCYQFSCDGWVLNGGAPISNYYCERVNPSYFAWARGRDGYTYCYQFTPYGHAMNSGRPVANGYCY